MNEEEIFHHALARSPNERAAYLEQACAGEPALRAAVEALLRANVGASGFLEQPAVAALATTDEPISERPGTVIGPYKLMEQIGEGGMGLVFVAEQQQPIRRKVALKVIKPGMDTRAVVARFEAERQALALMDHPNIARVLDAGATATGRPYFVMELVKGVPITQFCDDQRLAPRPRLELFADVCRAVQHAHQKGVIHRDIKPSNVLVTSHDGTPVVKVIDFGVAKAIGQHLTDKTVYTQLSQLIGTPLYMSPEQAGQSGLDVDTRSDIYSLGVLLYELLTGTTPFDQERLKEVGYDELRRIIREEEPPRPSTRISTLGQAATTVSTQRRSDPKQLSRLCRGELDWIVMKCLEKDRNRRYESATALAADVQRYLHDEPVAACPPSAAYRLWKWQRKHRAAAGAGVALVLALVLILLGLAANNLMIRSEQERTQAANKRLQENLKLSLAALDETFQMLEVRLPGDVEATKENEELLRKALGFYETFAERNQDLRAVRREVVEAYLRASDLYFFLGHFDKAEIALSRASDVAAQLNAESPGDVEARWLLAKAHQGRGTLLFTTQGPTAVSDQEFRDGITLLEPWGDAAVDHRYRNTLADLSYYLTWNLYKSGTLSEAEKHARQAIKVRRRLVAEVDELPQRLAYTQSLAMDHNQLACVLTDARRLVDAEGELREEIDLLAQVDVQAGKVPGYRRGQLPKFVAGSPYRGVLPAQTGAAHVNLGDVLHRRGRSSAATTEYSQAIDLFSRASRDWPRDTQIQRDLAVCFTNLGLARFEAGNRSQAAQEYRKAMDLLRTLDAQAPDTDENQARLSEVLLRMGDLLHAEGDREKAANHYRELLDLLEKIAARAPDVASYKKDLAWFLVACADSSFRNPARAVGLAEKAVASSPQNATFLHTLGMAQYRQAQWQAAIASLNKAKQLCGESDESDWLFLAMAHWRLGDKKTAQACYERAVEILKRYEWPPAEAARWRAEAAALLERSAE
jgi:serine/threonine protein kinase/Flp pilus assembly protein TadD